MQVNIHYNVKYEKLHIQLHRVGHTNISCIPTNYLREKA